MLRVTVSAAAVENVEAAAEEAAGSGEVFEEGGGEIEYADTGRLSIYFKAEGFISDVSTTAVTKALEAQERVSNVKVSVVDGAATVQCMKESTVDATGAAAVLLESIQSAGFQVQMVYIGFDDEAEADPTFFNFRNTRLPEEALPEKITPI